MRQLSLIDYTDTAEGHFVGQLLQPSTTQWTQNKDSVTTAFRAVDVTSGCTVAYNTDIRVTGRVDAPLPDQILKRMVSLYIVQSLDGEWLDEACDYLVDTFSWWAHPPVVPKLKSETRVASVPAIVRTKAAPLSFDD